MMSIQKILKPGENGDLVVIRGKLMEIENNSYSFDTSCENSDEILVQFVEPKGDVNRVIFKMVLSRDQAKTLKKGLKTLLKEMKDD